MLRALRVEGLIVTEYTEPRLVVQRNPVTPQLSDFPRRAFRETHQIVGR